MSTTEVTERVDESILQEGADVIASLPLVTGIKEGDNEIATKNLLNPVNYGLHLAWQGVLERAYRNDPVLSDKTSTPDVRRERRENIVSQIVDRRLQQRSGQK